MMRRTALNAFSPSPSATGSRPPRRADHNRRKTPLVRQARARISQDVDVGSGGRPTVRKWPDGRSAKPYAYALPPSGRLSASAADRSSALSTAASWTCPTDCRQPGKEPTAQPVTESNLGLGAAARRAVLLVWSDKTELLAYRARTNDLLYCLVVGLSCGSIRRP